jgi:hypothetical protein
MKKTPDEKLARRLQTRGYRRQLLSTVMVQPLAAQPAESTGRVPAEQGWARRSTPSGREHRPEAAYPQSSDDGGLLLQTRHRPPGLRLPERRLEERAAIVPPAMPEAKRPPGPTRRHGPKPLAENS